jgi:hypothetical protein
MHRRVHAFMHGCKNLPRSLASKRKNVSTDLLSKPSPPTPHTLNSSGKVYLHLPLSMGRLGWSICLWSCPWALVPFEQTQYSQCCLAFSSFLIFNICLGIMKKQKPLCVVCVLDMGGGIVQCLVLRIWFLPQVPSAKYHTQKGFGNCVAPRRPK